jgi:hemolysin III
MVSPSVERPLLRGKLHEATFYTTLAAGPALVIGAPTGHRLAASVYAVTLSALFGVSALYHRIVWSPRARGVLKRLDHSMIFLLIAGTYTAASTIALPDGSARWLLVTVWAGAFAGIVQQVLRPDLPNPVTALPYLALGWVAVAIIGELYRSLGAGGFALLLAGGIAYTAGALAYALRRASLSPRLFGYHEVFHALVIVGAAAHYAMLASAYLSAA